MDESEPQDEPQTAGSEPGANKENRKSDNPEVETGHDEEKRASPPSLVVDRSYVMRLRELQLELQKTRNQAEAARLEARAADLEIRIQRMGHRSEETTDRGTSAESQEVVRLNATAEQLRQQIQLLQQSATEQGFDLSTEQDETKPTHGNEDTPVVRVDQAELQLAKHDQPPIASARATNLATHGTSDGVRFDSWDQLRKTIHRVRGSRPENDAGSNSSLSSQADAWPSMKMAGDSNPSGSTADISREDAAHPTWSKSASDDDQLLRMDAAHPKTEWVKPRPESKPRKSSIVAPEEFRVEDDSANADPSPRWRPAAWLVSLIAHGVILVLLALFTLSTSTPGDQIAMAGSMDQTDEVAIESIEIVTPEVEIPNETPTPTETPYEMSDVGEIAASEIEIDAPDVSNHSLIDSIVSATSPSQSMMSLKSESDATMKFCGLEGGGNHFVYLVDSSGSMGDAFPSARRELLQSIEALKSEQRFYVIFFDAESDYMRLTSSTQDEKRSVYATKENKAALRRWAMTIQMDRGRAPWDALRFAIDLRPDVVFLLSDGEFPESIENLLNEINRVDNLFGDDDPISIVHTIGYHSREGESRMRRIAKQHGGQYRHVPKP